MLFTIGTESELCAVESLLPQDIFKALFKNTIILDYAYGNKRNYLERGGYTLIAQTADDVSSMRKIVDYTKHPPEWVDRFEKYLQALFVINNDFSIVLIIPLDVAPDSLLDEIEH